MTKPRLSDRECVELSSLIRQAWELRDSPYSLDACAALADWIDRWILRRWEQHLEAEAERRKRGEAA
jgi:hypothetical protein